jgi:hypothetical protein
VVNTTLLFQRIVRHVGDDATDVRTVSKRYAVVHGTGREAALIPLELRAEPAQLGDLLVNGAHPLAHQREDNHLDVRATRIVRPDQQWSRLGKWRAQ